MPMPSALPSLQLDRAIDYAPGDLLYQSPKNSVERLAARRSDSIVPPSLPRS